MTRFVAFKGNGRFDYDIVGESFYQNELSHLAGPKAFGGVDVDCLALILLEDNNKYDDKAVAIGIMRRADSALKVGHLSRSNARMFRKQLLNLSHIADHSFCCRAKIIGGWIGEGSADGKYGVKLDLKMPLSLYSKGDHLVERLL